MVRSVHFEVKEETSRYEDQHYGAQGDLALWLETSKVMVATPIGFAATPTAAVLAVAAVAVLLFPPVSFGQRFLRGSAKM